MAFVTAQLLQPYKERPNEGSLAIFTEFSPMADPSFEPGRPGEFAGLSYDTCLSAYKVSVLRDAATLYSSPSFPLDASSSDTAMATDIRSEKVFVERAKQLILLSRFAPLALFYATFSYLAFAFALGIENASRWKKKKLAYFSSTLKKKVRPKIKTWSMNTLTENISGSNIDMVKYSMGVALVGGVHALVMLAHFYKVKHDELQSISVRCEEQVGQGAHCLEKKDCS
ncbi:hypothetical protein ACFE04_027073 [Oxalis oulophora]